MYLHFRPRWRSRYFASLNAPSHKRVLLYRSEKVGVQKRLPVTKAFSFFTSHAATATREASIFFSQYLTIFPKTHKHRNIQSHTNTHTRTVFLFFCRQKKVAVDNIGFLIVVSFVWPCIYALRAVFYYPPLWLIHACCCSCMPVVLRPRARRVSMGFPLLRPRILGNVVCLALTSHFSPVS